MSSHWSPARNGRSIYDHISDNLGPDAAMRSEGDSLPDEGRVMPGELKWAPGAMEGAFGHHAGGGDDSHDRANRVADRLNTAARRPSKRNLVHLYNAVCGDDILSMVDRVVARVTSPGVDRSRVHEIGRWLA